MHPAATASCPDPFHHARRPPVPPIEAPPGVDTEGTRACAWCSRSFPVVVRPGRPRIYCRASCRQRSYERRAGLGVLPPVDRRVMRPHALDAGIRRPPAYEGGWSPAGERLHAMRPAGRPDGRGKWPSLCGVMASPANRAYAEVHPRACTTCAEVQRLRPTARALAAPQSLAVLRSIIEDAGTWLDRRDRWMRGHWVTDDQPPKTGTFGDVRTVRDVLATLIEAA